MSDERKGTDRSPESDSLLKTQELIQAWRYSEDPTALFPLSGGKVNELIESVLALRTALEAMRKERDEARAELDVLKRNGLNAIRLTLDETRAPHTALALLKTDHTALRAFAAQAVRALVGVVTRPLDDDDECARRWDAASEFMLHPLASELLREGKENDHE